MVVRIDDSDLKAAMVHLGRAFRKAEEGKVLKRELSKRLRKLMKPMVDERKARVLALPSKGHAGESMRTAVARKTVAATRYGPKTAGVSVIQRARGMPRDFRMAGRMFNRETGWNPKNLAGIVGHQEIKPAQWFDGASTGDARMAREEIIQAVNDAADRLGDDIRRIR